MDVVDLSEPRSSLCGRITMCVYDPRLSDFHLPLHLKGHKPKKLHTLVQLMCSFHFNTHEGTLILLHKTFNSR